MGYYPVKIAVVLHVLVTIGYGVIDCIIGGQILSAVSDGSMNVVVGIIIVGLVSGIMAVFGMSIFYWYQRCVFGPFIWKRLLKTVEMGMASAGHRSLRASRFCGPQIQHNYPLAGRSHHHQCEPAVLLLSLPLSPGGLDTHLRRLLRILPGEDASMDHFYDDSYRTGGIENGCVSAWNWPRL